MGIPRSFSRPEKLWLKIYTGSSGTVYSYWVEKALLFPNWSSFSRQMPSPYVSNFCGFSLHLGGGSFRHTRHKTTDILLREARKLGDIFPTCKDNRSYNIHIGIKLKTVLSRTFGRRDT